MNKASLSTLGAVCEKPQYGWTTSAKKGGTKGDLKILRTTDISSGKVDWDTVPFCVQKPKEISKYLLSEGDIVISRAGSIGLSYLIEECPPAVFASYLIRLRPTQKIHTPYLMHFLHSSMYWSQVKDAAVGIGLPNINGTKLKNMQIPLPDIQTQKVIAKKLTATLPRVRAALERIEKAKQVLRRFRQAVLSAACTGALTSEPQENFQQIALADLGEWRSGGTPSKSKSSYWTNGSMPWVSPKDMKKRYIGDAQDHITDLALKEGGAHLLPKNALIFVVRGMILAHSFPVALTTNKVTINQDIKAILLNPDIDPEYALIAFENARGEVLREVRNSTHGTNRLETDTLKKMTIPLPSFEAQGRIVKAVSDCFEVADQVEKAISKTSDDCEVVSTAVLHKFLSLDDAKK